MLISMVAMVLYCSQKEGTYRSNVLVRPLKNSVGAGRLDDWPVLSVHIANIEMR